MIDLPRQQGLALLRLLAIGPVDGDAADAPHATLGVGRHGGRADAPTHLAAGPGDARFGLERVLVAETARNHLLDPRQVLGMDEAADVFEGGREAFRIDAENTVLA